MGGDDLDGTTGSYLLSKEKALLSPEKPVYKLEGKDRYIFFNPGSSGWRISTLKNLSGKNMNDYMYASKSKCICLSI